MVAGDTSFCFPSVIKFSKAFSLCEFKRESMRVRE